MIDNTVFVNNSLTNSTHREAVRFCTIRYEVELYDTRTKRNIQAEFRNTIFKNHVLNLYFRALLSVVSIESYMNVTFFNCTFMDNQATAIRALQTNLIFEGNNTFLNNSGG